MKRFIFILLLFILVIVTVGSIFYSMNYKKTTKTYQVSINNYTFNPSELRIKKGDTIVWTNTDDLVHTITPNQNDNLENNILFNGQSFNHTFYTSGTYSYHCDDHQTMTGTIIVE